MGRADIAEPAPVFRGWPPAEVEFFEGLHADNSKSYWTAHRSTYESCVRGPMEELLSLLAPEFGEGKIFRPYRDVWLSADKSPYKTSMAATLPGRGYVHFLADGLGAGRGSYHLEGEQLERYRRAVADDRTGEELAGIVSAVRRARITFPREPEERPSWVANDHPRIDLLRHMGLVAWKDWAPEETAQAPALVTDLLRASAPLQEWLTAYVG